VEEVVTLLIPYLGIVNFDFFLGLFVVLVPFHQRGYVNLGLTSG